MEIEVTTQPSDFEVRKLGLLMREADKREVFASSGEDPITALEASVEASDQVWMFFGDGEPLCISGVAPITESIGAPWLLCTDKIHEVEKKTFWMCSKELMNVFQEHYHVLTNYVDVRNEVAARWLQGLGFEEKETIPYGHSRLPFTRFEYVRNDNV